MAVGTARRLSTWQRDGQFAVGGPHLHGTFFKKFQVDLDGELRQVLLGQALAQFWRRGERQKWTAGHKKNWCALKEAPCLLKRNVGER